MSWCKKDIIAEIKKNQEIWRNAGYETIDLDLPYWELRKEYTQLIYSIAFHGSGSRSFGQQQANIPPPDINDEICVNCIWKKDCNRKKENCGHWKYMNL